MPTPSGAAHSEKAEWGLGDFGGAAAKRQVRVDPLLPKHTDFHSLHF